MKYDLMPKAIRQEQRQRYIKQWFRPFCMIFLVLTVAAAGGGSWLQSRAEEEKIYYTDQVYPYVRQIQKQNQNETLMKKHVEAMETAEKKCIHWAAVLVCLADTKPQEGLVQTLSVKDSHVTIEGQAPSKEFMRTWQEKLRHQPSIAAVSMGKTTEKSKDSHAFRLDLEVKPGGTASEKD